MSYHAFITRAPMGNNREAHRVAAKRLHSAWLPLEMVSRSVGRKQDRRSIVQVRHIMDYLFCEGTTAQIDHLREHRSFQGRPLWYLPPSSNAAVSRFKADVEAAFRENMAGYLRNERQFHYRFKPGEMVRLRVAGQDIVNALVCDIGEFGDVTVEVEMLGSKRRVAADPLRIEV